jgi:hypothetical protein
VSDHISIISVTFLLCSILLVRLIRGRIYSPGMQWIMLLVAYSIVNGLCMYVTNDYAINSLMWNSYTLVEIVLLTLFFIHILDELKWLIICSGVFLLLILWVETIHLNFIRPVNITLIVESGIFTGFVLLSFNKTLKELKNFDLLRWDIFWVNFGILIFFSFGFLGYLGRNIYNYNSDYGRVFYVLHNVMYTLHLILILIGLCLQKVKNKGV